MLFIVNVVSKIAMSVANNTTRKNKEEVTWEDKAISCHESHFYFDVAIILSFLCLHSNSKGRSSILSTSCTKPSAATLVSYFVSTRSRSSCCCFCQFLFLYKSFINTSYLRFFSINTLFPISRRTRTCYETTQTLRHTSQTVESLHIHQPNLSTQPPQPQTSNLHTSPPTPTLAPTLQSQRFNPPFLKHGDRPTPDSPSPLALVLPQMSHNLPSRHDPTLPP